MLIVSSYREGGSRISGPSFNENLRVYHQLRNNSVQTCIPPVLPFLEMTAVMPVASYIR